jgi:hypothetical protein
MTDKSQEKLDNALRASWIAFGHIFSYLENMGGEDTPTTKSACRESIKHLKQAIELLAYAAKAKHVPTEDNHEAPA